jgi:hypothetical protein
MFHGDSSTDCLACRVFVGAGYEDEHPASVFLHPGFAGFGVGWLPPRSNRPVLGVPVSWCESDSWSLAHRAWDGGSKVSYQL